MKNKVVLKKNMLTVFLACLVLAIAEEVFFAYYAFNVAEEDNRFVFVIVMCLIVFAVLFLACLPLKEYLLVNDETVTLCKLFKRRQTVYWKNAEISETTVYAKNGSHQVLTIRDHASEITFSSIGAKDKRLLKELSANARPKAETNDLTF